MSVSVRFTCDDFGMSPEVNEAIQRWVREGKADAVSILANGPCTEDAVAFATANPDAVSYGVHLDASEFPPVSDPSAIPSLVNGDGRFARDTDAGGLLGWRRLRALVREWGAQITSLTDRGVPVTHLDTHRHVHSAPGIFTAYLRVARGHDIPYVRGTKTIYPPGAEPGWSAYLAKSASRLVTKAAGLDTAENLTDLGTLVQRYRNDNLPVDRGTIECICHPGHPQFAEENRAAEASAIHAAPADERAPRDPEEPPAMEGPW